MVFSGGGSDTQIASVSIGSSLDLTGFLRGLDTINRLDLPELKLEPIVNLKPLHDLNDLLDVKDRHFKKINKDWKLKPLVPSVDATSLSSLNKQFEMTRREYDLTKAKFNKPIAPKFDMREFERVKLIISDLERKAITINAAAKSQPASTPKQSSDSSQQLLNAARDTNKQLAQLASAAKSSKQGLFGNVLAGFGQQIGFQISSGVQASLKKQFNIDLRQAAKSRTDAVSVPIKALFTENAELRSSIERAGAKLDERFKEAGYKVGDAIVEALDAEGATIRQRLGMIFSQSVKGGNFKKNLQETLREVRPEGISAVRSIVAGSYVRGKVQRAGQNLGAYREQAIADRAVPLVRQRALEILNQENKKNSAQSVTDDTKQLFITVGGYAGTEGKSGAMIARMLKQDKQLPKGSQVIYVVNKDTDVSASSVESKPNKILERMGLGLGGEWVGEVAKSLAKPNLRGYSKDAVEIASQALAAKERNPEIKIRIVGESGGGFAAEEAVKILQQMGISDAEYIGVGTPNFMGGLNAKGRKVISPDESLGLLNKVASRYGFSDASATSQNVLGVEEHPLRYYRQANTAELENFLYGRPEPMSEKQIASLKKQAQEEAKTNFGAMTPKELDATAKTALDNYEYLRRFLIDSQDEANETIAEIAAIYKKIYLRASKEPEQFKKVRAKINQASAILARISSDPGIESGMRADQIKKELEKTLKEFINLTTQFDGTLYEYVGTVAEKRDELAADLKALIAKFDNPQLGVKQPQKPIEPDEVMSDRELRMPVVFKKGELEAQTPGLAKRVVDGITTPIGMALDRAKDAIVEGVENFVIDRVNDQLMRVPGQPDVLDPSRQIGALDELTPGDYLKLARIGTEDTMRGLAGGTAKAYSVAKGTENALFGAIPPLALIKAFAQRVGLPMAAFSAAGALPGVGAAEGAMTGVTESLLAMPAEQLATVMSGAFADAVTTTIANIPFIGSSLAPAMTAAVAGLLHNAAGAVAGGAAEVITPIVGGQIMLGAAGQAAKSALPALPEAQVRTNRMIQAATEDRLKKLQSGVEYIKAMLPVDREAATRYLSGLQQDFPQLKGDVSQAIEAIPAGQRMGEGSALAGLKGQIVKAQQSLMNAEKQITAFTKLVQGVTKSFQEFSTSVRGENDNIIDVEFSEVREQRALPAAKSNLPASQDKLQKQVSEIVQYTRKQIEDIGEEFSRQRESLKNKALPPQDKAKIAASINRLALESKKAIDDVVKSFGDNVPAEIKKSAQYAKQKITKADTRATDVTTSAKQSGVAIPEGFNEGIESRVSALKSTAKNMAQVVILAAENELEIKSPSRVFMRIGEQIVEGLSIGLKGLDKAKGLVNNALNIEPGAGVAANLRNVAKSPVVNDLVVNSAGFAASRLAANYGIVPELGADLGAALATRQALNAGRAVVGSYDSLKDDEVFQASSALEKFTMVLTEAIARFQSQDFQKRIGEELTGDLTGFTIGNAAAIAANAVPALAPVPLKGAAVAMATVPSLVQMRDRLGGTGEAIPEGLTQGIQSGTGELESVAASMAQAVIVAAEEKLEIRSPSRVFKRIGEMIVAGLNQGLGGLQEVQSTVANALDPNEFEKLNQQIANAANDPDAAYEALKTMERLRYKMQQEQMNAVNPPEAKKSNNPISAFIEETEKQIGLAQGSVKRFGNLIKNTVLGFIGFNVLSQIVPLIGSFTDASAQAAREFEQFERSLTFATGSADAAKSTLAALRDEANGLGIDLRSSIQGQAQLMAATRNTSLEGFATEQIGSATRQAIGVYGLTPEQAERVQLAIQQMASKGKISAEELRQQLGESLPGAFQIAARSIGVTTAQLDKMLQNGQVLSDDFLPKFAAQLAAETSTAVSGAANSSQASLNRFNNTLYETQVAIGETILPLQNLSMNIGAGGLELLADNFGTISTAITALTLTAFRELIEMLVILGVELVKFNVKAALSGGVFASLGSAAAAAGKAIQTAFTAINNSTFLKIFVALEGLKDLGMLASKVFEDGAGELRTFADDARESFDAYIGSTTEAIDATDSFADRFQNALDTIKNTKAPSILEDTLIGRAGKFVLGEELGSGLARNIERSVQQDPLRTVPIVGQAYGLARDSGLIEEPLFQLTTYSEKIVNDTIIASNDLQQAVNDTLIDVQSKYFGVDGQLAEPIKRLNELDRRIADTGAKLRALDPNDSEGRRQLLAEQEELRKQREEANAPIAAAQAQLAERIQTLADARKQLEQQIGKAGTPKEQEQLQRELDEITKLQEDAIQLQDEFTKSLDASVTPAQKLQREFALISAQLEEASNLTRIFGARSRETLANRRGIPGGLTQGQVAAAGDQQQVQLLQRQIQDNQKALDKFLTTLNDPAIIRALELNGLRTETDFVNASDVQYQAERLGDSPEGEQLSRAAEALKERDRLRAEIADGNAQIAEAQAQARESVIEANKQIAEYIRNMGRSIAEIGLTIEQSNLETQILQTKNDLKQQLNGFSDRFFGDFISGIEGMIDLLNEPLRRSIEARRELEGLNNQQADAQRQGGELARSSYGGVGFDPYQVDTTYFIDDSPVGSYDFTISQNGNYNPAVPSPVSGTVTQAGEMDGYGNVVAVQDAASGMEWFFAHLDSVSVEVGQQVAKGFALGMQGTTGRSTGEHLHAEIYDLPYSQGGSRITDRSVTQPMVEGYIDELRAGFTPTTAQAAPASSAQPTPVAITNMDALFQGGSSSPLARIIGLSEGTRTSGGGFTDAYGGHTDPGNAAHNMGSFSYQHGASSGEEADIAWLNQMRQVLPDFVAEARAAGLDPNDPRLLANFFDLYTQAPLAATGEGGFLDQLSTIASQGVSDQSILDARMRSYINPATGRLDAPGFGNSPDALRADQQRRMAALNQGIPEVFNNVGGFAPSPGGASQPGVDTSGISSSLDQYSNSLDQQRESILQRVAEEDRASYIALEQQMDKRQEELNNAQRDLINENREYQERYEDSIFAAFGNTPIAERLSQLAQATRESESTLRRQQLTLEQARTSLEKAVIVRDELLSNPELEPLRDLVPGLDTAIATFETEIDSLEQSVEREQTILQQRRDAILRDMRETQAVEMRQLADRNEDLTIQSQISRIQSPGLQQLGQFRLQRRQLDRQYSQEVQELEVKVNDLVTGIQRLQEEGFAVDSTEMLVAQEELDNTLARIDAINQNRIIELDILANDQASATLEQIRNQRQTLVQEQATYLNNRGDVFGANAVQRQLGEQQIQQEYLMERASIEQALAQNLISPQAAETSLSYLEQISNYRLDNLRTQFESVGDSINRIAIDGFGGLMNGLSDVILNGGKLSDVFDQVSKQIINSLLQIGTQFLQSELYNLFFPQRDQGAGAGGILGSILGGGSGGGLLGSLNIGGAAPSSGGGGFGGGNLIGGLLSSGLSLIGFNEGGPIAPGYGGGDKYPLLGEAGEFVIRKEAVKALGGIPAMEVLNNAHKMPKYATGGMIGVPPAPSIPRSPVAPSTPRSPVMVGAEDRAIDINYNVSEINSVRYVTEEQFRAGMDVAAKRGAQGGRDQAFRDMQRSPNIRRGLGI